MPIFVARQWIRHRTANVNEMSGRYSLMPMLFYAPPDEQLKAQSAQNHQGRAGEALDAGLRQEAQRRWQTLRSDAVATYEWLNGNEVARELARIDLPLSTYTQWYWKIDLHNLLHFLSLRVDAHAQWEIQQFGRVMAGMLKRVAPLSYEAWIDYDVCGAHLSRMELEVLRDLLSGSTEGLDAKTGRLSRAQMEAKGMSGREVEEMLAHLAPRPTPDFELDVSQAKSPEYFERKAAAAVPTGAPKPTG
jgi:thymidylate synthase (FAD)